MTPLAIDLFCGLGGWTEGLLAEGPTPAAALIANGDQFAISDAAVLSIKQGENAIYILPDSFARLRKFIERAESIFNPTE